MSEERRAAPRARIPGSFVHGEGAGGERIQADVLNLSEGGLFIPTRLPLAVGKRLTLRLQVGGATAPWWSALGRVLWVRQSATKDGPAGMGVKLLDIEEEGATAAIARMVDERLLAQAPAISTREKTVLGVGVAVAASSAPPSDDDVGERPTFIGELSGHVERERTIQGIGLSPANGAPAEEAPPAVSVAPVLVVEAPLPSEPVPPAPASPESEPPVSEPPIAGSEPPIAASEPPIAASEPPIAASEPPIAASEPPIAAGVPRRRSGGWLVVLLMLAVGGAAAYSLQDRWLPRARTVFVELTGSPAPPQVPAPPPPTSAPLPATASAPVYAPASASASGSSSSALAAPTAASSGAPTAAAPSASARTASSAAPATSRPPVRRPLPVATPPQAVQPPPKKADDNPY